MDSLEKKYTAEKFTDVFLTTESGITSSAKNKHITFHSGSLVNFTDENIQYEMRIDEYIQQYIQELDYKYNNIGKNVFSIIADKHEYCNHTLKINLDKKDISVLTFNTKKFKDINKLSKYIANTLDLCNKHVISVGIYPSTGEPHQTIIFIENGNLHYYDPSGTTTKRSLTFKYDIIDNIISPLFSNTYTFNIIKQNMCIQGYIKDEVGYCILYSLLWLYLSVEADTYGDIDKEIISYFTTRGKHKGLYNFIMYFIYILSVENRILDVESHETIERILENKDDHETFREIRKRQRITGGMCKRCGLPQK